MNDAFAPLRRQISGIQLAQPIGRVREIEAGLVKVQGLTQEAAIGDRVCLGEQSTWLGEVVGVSADRLTIMPEMAGSGLAIGTEVRVLGPISISPDGSWIGRVINPLGKPLDGRPLLPGPVARPVITAPPEAVERQRLGERLSTGTACFDTLLPIVRGQRIGLFAGSGVGKSSLLGQFARHMAADVVVIALIGERGRELREFLEVTLGPKGLARSVVVAATSDQSALLRRQCILSALTIAEHFRDEGREVLLLADSVTRFAEAHREIALLSGEPPSLKGYPPSIQAAIMAMAERSGPGHSAQGNITAIFSVLVPGSDMEEPVADILRGVLDGHVVLDRKIAERGRFPAVDILRSVSRSLPWAASAEENELISAARRLISTWENSEMMVQAGLYQSGSDPAIDRAIQKWPALDEFLSRQTPNASIHENFELLSRILGQRQGRTP